MIGLVRINNYKFELTQAIKHRLEPRMWASGFIKNFHERMIAKKGEEPETTYIRLCNFGDDEDGEMIAHYDEFTDFRIEGFTEDGIIVDSYGAICVTNYEDCMLEQLVFAWKIAQTIQ